MVSGHIQGVDLCDAQSENDVAEGPGQAEQESWSRDGNMQQIQTGRLVHTLPARKEHRSTDLQRIYKGSL